MEALTRKIWTPRVKPPSTVYAETAESVAAQLEKGGGVIMEAGGEPIGSGRWVPVPGPEEDDRTWMEVKRIGVLEPFTGSGFGAEILQALETQGRERGCAGAQLAVRYDQPRLVDYYAEHGYQLADNVSLTTVNHAAPPPIGMRKLF